jgi:hypothetical protein
VAFKARPAGHLYLKALPAFDIALNYHLTAMNECLITHARLVVLGILEGLL